MSTGLPPDITDKDPEWVLHFCNFCDAWTEPPKPGGKSMGEGIIVIHPDTGFTMHPELWDTFRIVDGKQADDRYLTHKARNFIDPGQPADDKLSLTDYNTIILIGMAEYYGVLPPNPMWEIQQIRHPSHGTATASVLMSKRGPPDLHDFPDYPVGPGFVSGVAPLVKVIPYKVTETVILNSTTSINLATSIQYAVSLSRSSTVLDNVGFQIGVISISLGGLDFMTKRLSLEVALVAARMAGIVVVAAAGQGTGEWSGKKLSPIYPGNDPNTICVAACNYKHEKYIKGFYGSSVDITAPGDFIWKAHAERVKGYPNIYYPDQGDGTSYATAIVAGACALWQAHHGRANLLKKYGPELIFDVFKKVLQDSCDKPAGWDSWDFANRGAGVLDAEKLLLEPLPAKSVIEGIRGG